MDFRRKTTSTELQIELHRRHVIFQRSVQVQQSVSEPFKLLSQRAEVINKSFGSSQSFSSAIIRLFMQRKGNNKILSY